MRSSCKKNKIIHPSLNNLLREIVLSYMSNLEELPCTAVADPVVQAAQDIFGIKYPFPWQRLIIAAVLDAFLPIPNTDENPKPLREIAVLPTGAGKSLCWMLPAVMIPGLTIAVFPLLSLMTDQERRLKDSDIASVCLRGGQSRDERRGFGMTWKVKKQE